MPECKHGQDLFERGCELCAAEDTGKAQAIIRDLRAKLAVAEERIGKLQGLSRWMHSDPSECELWYDGCHCLEARVEELSKALTVAADALDIASDWHVGEVQVDPPKEWKLDAISEDPDEGWCSTSALAQKLRELAK